MQLPRTDNRAYFHVQIELLFIWVTQVQIPPLLFEITENKLQIKLIQKVVKVRYIVTNHKMKQRYL